MKRLAILPAELRNGLYVKPVALLEPEQLWCGRSEVWTSSHGRATRYHVMVDDGCAACRPHTTRWKSGSMIILETDSLIPIAEVEGHMACRAPGCFVYYRAFLS